METLRATVLVAVLISAAVLANGQVFSRREDISGVSVTSDGTVYVSGESTVYRLAADLSGQSSQLSLGPSARVIGYLADENQNRAILCWVNSTYGACEVRSLIGNAVNFTTRNMRPNDAYGRGSTVYYMFRGDVTAQQLVSTRIAVSGGDFLVAQPVVKPDETPGTEGSSAMTMVRFNASAQIEGYTGVVRNRFNVFLSGTQQFINSFQAIFESDDYYYFMYTILPPAGDNTYDRPITQVARVCKVDDSSRLRFNKYSPGAYVSMTIIPMAESNLNIWTVVSSAVFAKPSPDLGSDSLLVMSFMQTISSSGLSSIYALGHTSLDSSLQKVYSDCISKSSDVRGSPMSTGADRLCSIDSLRIQLLDLVSLNSLVCEAGGARQAYHYPFELNPPIQGGTFPSVGDLLYESPTLVFTSVRVHVIDNVTLLLAGTKNGRLLRLHVRKSSNKLEALVFNQEVVDTSSRPLTSLTVSHDSAYVYIVANKTDDSAVYRRPLIDCSPFTSCQSCLNVSAQADIQHPLCGWCATTATCTRQTQCNSAFWERTPSQCPSAVSLTPNQAPIQVATNVVLTATGSVPNVSAYECRFDSQVSSKPTSAQRQNSGGNAVFTCPTPTETSLNGQTSFDSEVTIYAMGNNAPLVNSGDLKITLYDCTAHARCSACQSSRFTCGWCNYDNECTHHRDLCRQHNTDSADWTASGSIQCPVATLQLSNPSLPTGLSKAYTFAITNAVPARSGASISYSCRFTSGSTTEDTSASLNPARDTVSCSAKTLPSAFGGSTGIQPGQLAVVFNSYQLDASPVTYYTCQALGRDCTACLARVQNYTECFFCGGQSECLVSTSSCSTQRLMSVSGCPSPVVTGVTPPDGPVNGGSTIRVTGTNLGVTVADITSIYLQIGQSQFSCTQPSNFKLGDGVSCTTTAAQGQENIPMGITVNIQNAATPATLNNAYTYRVVSATMATPVVGPVSGGTEITITGQYLNVSSASGLSVTVNGLMCTVRTRTFSSVVCVTGAAPSVGSGALVLNLDGYRASVTNFAYMPNPNISTLTPIDRTETIDSGGTKFSVFGSGFSVASVFQANFRLATETMPFRNSSCSRTSDTELSCETVQRPNTATSVVVVDLRMDGYLLRSVANITYLSNPTFNDYSPKTTSEIGDSVNINIEGVGFNRAGLRRSDYNIRIGAQSCAIQSINPEGSQIFCSLIFQSSGEFSVVIEVGNYTVSLLPALTVSSADSGIAIAIIIGPVAGGAAILILIIVILVVRYRRKAKEQSLEMSKLLIQMDNIEANVARECKEAFTELQTNLGAIASSEDTSNVTIPFLKFEDYALHMLFPQGQSEQLVLRPLDQKLGLPEDDLHRLNEVLDKFEARLLLDRRFLIPFIHTLENQGSKFSMRDRVMVASLLMVALQDNLYYATEILKLLLGDLIKKTVAKNPKLLLRRTESVAEKLLTNWLTFCLHDYIRAVVGRPLFTLFRALKTHLENGPVDAMTGEAKNSLSEEKLLREKVDYKELQCIAVWEKTDQYSVRLLDCDTISQAKEKVLDAMYNTTPISQRPDFFGVDLGWYNANSQSTLTLRDEDQSSVVDADGKRINTLAHFNVHTGAQLTLIDRRQDNGHVRDHTAMLIARAGVTSQLSQDEDGMKRWHLTRASEVSVDDRSRQGKLVSEVYLTRLLSAKKVLQKFVDDLFESIFKAGHSGQVPAAIKYLFDYIDQQALDHGITDMEAVQTWKNNSVPLRFWINVIKNPEFIFDIHKSTTIDACLSIIAQAFMDSCSTSELRLTKDSPSTKLLYAREVTEIYRPKVQSYYSGIREMPTISEGEMASMMGHASTEHRTTKDSGLNKRPALFELFQYACKYSDDISDSLSETNMANLVRILEELQDSSPVMPGNKRRV